MPETPAPAALIFDLDGTLIDSQPDIHATANALLAQYGYAPRSLAEVRSFIGRGVPHLVRCLLTAAGAPTDAAFEAEFTRDFVARYETAVELTVLYPGVTEALAEFARLGHPMAICTNKPLAPTLAILRHLAIDGRFQAVVGGDSLSVRKPDPAPLHHAHALLGGGPVLYLGDSEIDAETAVNAGVRFLLYTEGYRKTPVAALPHDLAFDDFTQLPELVAGLLRNPLDSAIQTRQIRPRSNTV